MTARCARARAEQVHGGYVHRARALDAAHHPHIAEPDDRPIYSRLLTFPRVRGQCVGAFAEFSSDLQLLCTETADAAAEHHWRTAGAASSLAARSVFVAIYRRRWGCAAALQGARMRLARACHARSGPGPGAGGDDGGTCGFDPGDHAAFAGAAAPIHGGFPAGQRRS